MLLKIVYLLTRRVLGLAVLVFRGDRAKDAELLVLRHENAVLRRYAGRVRYELADRVWFAALARLVPRRLRVVYYLSCHIRVVYYSDQSRRGMRTAAEAGMARRTGIWAEIQREHAQRRRAQQARLKAEGKALHQWEQQYRRQVAADEKERKRLYLEYRKAEAASMTAEVDARIAVLDGLLRSSLRPFTGIPLSSLRDAEPPFDPGGLDVPLPRPQWEQFAPNEPGSLGRVLGGAKRYERRRLEAEEAYRQQLAQHAAADHERQRHLAARQSAYVQEIAQIRARNAEADQFEQDLKAGSPEAASEYLRMVLEGSLYPEDFPQRCKLGYRSEPREVFIEYELPGQDIIPPLRGYKYVQTRDATDQLPRPDKEIKQRYSSAIAQPRSTA